ncbi:hypothetical protein LshimejAT787_0601450 [Lyophyllum shimeji]|uniref:Uncharacterized protein n=1 Tax=Lyophyllum shimeji TaxID=47721 RepID=A0A9P3PN79_LYOSH|nr:hypothetical protein LshimejAT787_0601450 [Lyophyllum shimeji]
MATSPPTAQHHARDVSRCKARHLHHRSDLENYLEFFGLTILFYDYLITIGDEVEGSNFNPYSQPLPDCTHLLCISCEQLHLTRQIALVINQGIVCLLLSLRVYALYSRSWRIAVFLLLSAALLGAVALAAQLFHRDDLTPGGVQYNCNVPVTKARAIRLAVAWECLFAYDVREYPIPAMVLKYGIIYFGTITLANAANIMTYWFSGPFMKGGLSLFAGSFSTVITSRFMLELYAVNRDTMAPWSGHSEAEAPRPLGPQPPASILASRGRRTLSLSDSIDAMYLMIRRFSSIITIRIPDRFMLKAYPVDATAYGLLQCCNISAHEHPGLPERSALGQRCNPAQSDFD